MNLLILAGTFVSCLILASCTVRDREQDLILETEPMPDSGRSIFKYRLPETSLVRKQVEVSLHKVSVSGNWVKVEVKNRTSATLSSVKGEIVFLDKDGEILQDTFLKRSYHPFSIYKMQGLVGSDSAAVFTIEMEVPHATKTARVLLKQAAHADGTVMQFKPSVR